jgi:hypothetical protein
MKPELDKQCSEIYIRYTRQLRNTSANTNSIDVTISIMVFVATARAKKPNGPIKMWTMQNINIEMDRDASER